MTTLSLTRVRVYLSYLDRHRGPIQLTVTSPSDDHRRGLDRDPLNRVAPPHHAEPGPPEALAAQTGADRDGQTTADPHGSRPSELGEAPETAVDPAHDAVGPSDRDQRRRRRTHDPHPGEGGGPDEVC